MLSISIPFRFEDGKVSDTENNSIIAKQRIIDVLATDRFERVNRPEYGLSLNSLLFDNFDPLVFADYKVDALRTLNDYVSNARIVDLQINRGNSMLVGNSEESSVLLRVIYRTSDGNTATFVANLSPNTFLTEESII